MIVKWLRNPQRFIPPNVVVVLTGILAQLIINFLVPELNGGIKSFLNPLVIIIITSGFKYYSEGMKLQIRLHEAQSKQYQAELDLLKHQVNPHFFFNTLNNLFSMARKEKDQSTAEGIAKLSHLMRYIIYDCNVDKIGLDKEIEQINSFIDLQKLRFDDDDEIEIKFEVNGHLDKQQITPMLLIPFVENAFKNGVSLKNASPIHIEINIGDDDMTFSIVNNVNKLRKDRDDENSGVGLSNVRRRLELLYPESHQLNIDNNGEQFSVFLQLNLN